MLLVILLTKRDGNKAGRLLILKWPAACPLVYIKFTNTENIYLDIVF